MSAYEFFKDFAGPIATVTAASVAAAVTTIFAIKQARFAEQQAKIAQNKLKIDTFEIRYSAYRATIEVAEAALHDKQFDDKDLARYQDQCNKALESEFLFSKDKYEIIKIVIGKSRSLRFQSMRMRRVEEEGKRLQEGNEKIDKTEKDLREIYDSLPSIFSNELSLEVIDRY